MACILSLTESIEQYDPLRQLMNFAVKGSTDSRVKKLEEYGGAKSVHHTAARLNYVLSRLQELESSTPTKTVSYEHIKGLKRIAQHRLCQFNYTQRIKSATTDIEIESIIDDIIENVSLLDEIRSEKTISLDDGTTLFCLPGGYKTHFVSYEFKKYKRDQEEEYYFTIHDRSFIGSDVASSIQGSLINRIVDGKIYNKTSLSIKTSKNALTNRKFIESLLKNFKYEKCVPYAEIHLFLVRIYDGEIVKSEVESLLERLFIYEKIGSMINGLGLDISMEKIQAIIVRLIKRAKDFHSMQQYLTCIESNSTEPEKQMAPGYVRKELKLYTLQKIDEQLESRLSKLETASDSDGVCSLKHLGKFINKKKSQYFEEAKILRTVAHEKKAYLIDKLNGKKTKHLNLEDTILSARALLERLDTCNDPTFVAQRNTAKEKVKSQLTLDRYIVEDNHNMEYFLDLVPVKLRQNFDFMLLVIKKHPNTQNINPWTNKFNRLFIKWANVLDDNLKNNPQFILEAIRINPMALNAASDTLKSDKSFIKRAFEIDPWSCICSSKEIRGSTKYIKQFLTLPENQDIIADFNNEFPKHLKEDKFFTNRYKKSENNHCCIIS